MDHVYKPWCTYPDDICTCQLFERSWEAGNPLTGFEVLTTVSTGELQARLSSHLREEGYPLRLEELDEETFEGILTEEIFPALEHLRGNRLHLRDHVVVVDADESAPTFAGAGVDS